jgi:hypothetical protein
MKASLIRWLYSAPNVILLHAKIVERQKYAIAWGSKKVLCQRRARSGHDRLTALISAPMP